jgi:hypothetical protein
MSKIADEKINIGNLYGLHYQLEAINIFQKIRE